MLDHWPLATTRRGALVVERTLLSGPRGVTALHQRFTGSDERVIVTHAAGIVALVNVLDGRLSFEVGGRESVAPERFVLAIPSRSCVRLRFSNAVVTSDGIGTFFGREKTAIDLPQVRTAPTSTPLEIAALLSGKVLFAMPTDEGVEPRIATVRCLLHEQLGALAPVARVSAQLGLSADVVTRSFRRAYGVTPKSYCTRARLFDAALRLLAGEDIVRTAFDSGFADLSRFYAQFRRVLGTTPGRYAKVGKRQDGMSTGD